MSAGADVGGEAGAGTPGGVDAASDRGAARGSAGGAGPASRPGAAIHGGSTPGEARRTGPIVAGGAVREARPDELDGWDARTVDVDGGDVQQSLAWAELRRRLGWRVHHLVLPDGSAALAVGWPYPFLGGGRLYVTKGPVAAGAGADEVAGRLEAIAAWARHAGYDAVYSDTEMPASTGYPGRIQALGFRQVEEIGPSRHRLAVPIERGADDAALAQAIAKTTRQRCFAAERRGVRIVRHDARSMATGDAGVEARAAQAGAGDGDASTVPGVDSPGGDARTAAEAALRRFHPLLASTGARRGFSIGPEATAVGWWLAAMAAGHLVLLEALAADGTYLGAAIFFRHGDRWTYGHAADVVALRHAQPGAAGLILWRALQLAARDGRRELDLGGVDVAGARREPRPGEPMYGLLTFKRSFGGRWVELTGAHELALRPARAAAGDAIAAVGRAARRLVAGRGGERR